MKDGKIQLGLEAVNHPRTLFKPGTWLTKIDFINNLILNNVLITVLSEKEGGKTSFSTLLQNNLNPQIIPIFITAAPDCDPQSIIDMIAAQLDYNIDKEANLSSLIFEINEQKAPVLLIMDDAHNVPESIIKEAMFAIKNQEDASFFHLCLIADYSVVATLNNLAVDQFNTLIYTIELGPLNESETRTYVLQRALTARLINRPLTDIQFKQLYNLTKGSLAKINSNLEPFILKCSTQQKNHKIAVLKTVSMVISVLMVLSIAYLYFNSVTVRVPDEYAHEVALTRPAATAEVVTNTTIQNPPLVSEIVAWNHSSRIQTLPFGQPNDADFAERVEENQEANNSVLFDKITAISNSQSLNSLVSRETPEVLDPTVISKPKLTHYSKTNKQQLVRKAVVQKLKASKYTIQLVASHNIRDVYRFKKSNNALAKAKVRHFTNAKGKWFILTLGEFDNRVIAEHKKKNLPEKMINLNPWIRSIKGLSDVG